ncbi:hypothetical protein [Streptomyces kebangsaanensis]|uniref:hypothetical protein n=1 Tax=Streptomyces kebangsaanensis TaxID=864058 RepID=UPI00093DF109|nr:hypothetical protein [Streptomyces kebangsaanensis]
MADDRDTLPLPDCGRLPLGSLESRVRSPTARPEQLQAGARPTRGDPTALRPGQGEGRAGSPATPAASPVPFGPPPHGTPDQRGKPKGDRS